MVLNCLCYQCRKVRHRHALYQAQTRKARRNVSQKLNYYTNHGIVDFEIPEKHRGIYAA
jgi:hypothetical protein